jgi:hypothetical protein
MVKPFGKGLGDDGCRRDLYAVGFHPAGSALTSSHLRRGSARLGVPAASGLRSSAPQLTGTKRTYAVKPVLLQQPPPESYFSGIRSFFDREA